MIPLNIEVDNFIIKNLTKEELDNVLCCINESRENLQILGIESDMTIEKLKQRYLETLVNSMEYFCSICGNDKVIGILKGRIENKNTKELWVLSFLILEKYRNKGIGTKLLTKLEEYFKEKFGITNSFVLVTDYNQRAKNFWKKNKYALARVTKNIGIDNELNIIILEKKG